MSSFLKIECSLLAQFWAPGVARGGAGLLESGGGVGRSARDCGRRGLRTAKSSLRRAF